MALLKPCGKFVNFAKISLLRQVQRYMLTPKQVLIMCILYNNSNKKINFKQKQISKKFILQNSVNKINTINDNNEDSDGLITLLDRIAILSNEFKNVKIDYDYLFDTIKMYGELIDNIDSSVDIFLLNCCGEALPNVRYEVRQKLTRQLWNLLQDKNRINSLYYYHTLINIYDQNYQDVNPDQFIDNMKIEPNKLTYLFLLQAVAKSGNSKRTNYILSKLKNFSSENSKKFFQDYSTRNQGNVLLKSANLSDPPSLNEIHGYLACGYALRGDINDVIKILDNYLLNHKQLLTVLKNICLLCDVSSIENILRYIPANEIVTNPILINTIIELVNLNKIHQASKIVDYIVTNNLQENTLNIVKNYLRALVRVNFPGSSIVKIGNELIVNNLYSLSSTELLLLLLEESLRCGNESLSFWLMNEMQIKNIELRPHYFWPLLVKAAKNNGESGVFNIIDNMIKMNVRLDHSTLFEYVLPNIYTLNPWKTITKLTNHGVKLRISVIAVISYLLANGKVSDAYDIINSLKIKISFDEILPFLVKAFEIHNDYRCVKLLQYAYFNRDYPGHFLLKILDNDIYVNNTYIIDNLVNFFNKYDISISHDTAESIIKNKDLQKKNPSIINMIQRLKTMNTKVKIIENINYNDPQLLRQIINNEDELKHIWHTMKSKGYYSHGVLCKLFYIYCKNDDLEQAKLIEKEFKNHNCELTPIMKNHLISLLARHGKIEEMYSLIVNLKKNFPSLYLTHSGITLQAAIALVNGDKMKIAWDLIDNSKTSDCHYQYLSWKLLNSIALSKRISTNLMLNSLVSKNFCEVNEMILEPLIVQHLVNNDLVAATKSFKYAATYYKEIPLHRDLVYHFIKSINDNPDEGNKILLQDILNQIYDSCGQKTVDIDLLIAYARCDLLSELKLSLMNLSSSKLLLEYFFDRLSDQDKLIILERIFEVSHEIDCIDRQPICDLLLLSYSNLDDWKSALELRKKMRDEGIKPTETFEKNLITFLSVHKIQPPSTLITYKEHLRKS